MDSASSPRLPPGGHAAGNSSLNDGIDLLLENKVRHLNSDLFDDSDSIRSGSINSMASVREPKKCLVCHMPEDLPLKPFVKCIRCSKTWHWQTGCHKNADFDPAKPVPRDCVCSACREKAIAREAQERRRSKKYKRPALSTTNIKSRGEDFASTADPTPIASSPVTGKASESNKRLAVCKAPGCEAIISSSIASIPQTLCHKHIMEAKFAKALAQPRVPSAPPSRPINKKKLYPPRPDDRPLIKRRKTDDTRRKSASNGAGLPSRAPDVFISTPGNGAKQNSAESSTKLSAANHTTNNRFVDDLRDQHKGPTRIRKPSGAEPGMSKNPGQSAKEQPKTARPLVPPSRHSNNGNIGLHTKVNGSDLGSKEAKTHGVEARKENPNQQAVPDLTSEVSANASVVTDKVQDGWLDKQSAAIKTAHVGEAASSTTETKRQRAGIKEKSLATSIESASSMAPTGFEDQSREKSTQPESLGRPSHAGPSIATANTKPQQRYSSPYKIPNGVSDPSATTTSGYATGIFEKASDLEKRHSHGEEANNVSNGLTHSHPVPRDPETGVVDDPENVLSEALDEPIPQKAVANNSAFTRSTTPAERFEQTLEGIILAKKRAIREASAPRLTNGNRAEQGPLQPEITTGGIEDTEMADDDEIHDAYMPDTNMIDEDIPDENMPDAENSHEPTNSDPITDLEFPDYSNIPMFRPQTQSNRLARSVPSEAILDSHLQNQIRREESSIPTRAELAAQTYGTIDPRRVWPQRMTSDQRAEKIKEIEARGGRKANMFKVFTAQNLQEKAEKGWEMHQWGDKREDEETAEMGRKLDHLFGVKGVELANMIPALEEGKLVMVEREKDYMEGEKRPPGRKPRKKKFPVLGPLHMD